MRVREKIEKWADELSEEQMKKVLVGLTEECCLSEMVRLGDLAPYWEATGDPLVEGQKTWSDDE